jgi:hypothetical protein
MANKVESKVPTSGKCFSYAKREKEKCPEWVKI